MLTRMLAKLPTRVLREASEKSDLVLYQLHKMAPKDPVMMEVSMTLCTSPHAKEALNQLFYLKESVRLFKKNFPKTTSKIVKFFRKEPEIKKVKLYKPKRTTGKTTVEDLLKKYKGKEVKLPKSLTSGIPRKNIDFPNPKGFQIELNA